MVELDSERSWSVTYTKTYSSIFPYNLVLIRDGFFIPYTISCPEVENLGTYETEIKSYISLIDNSKMRLLMTEFPLFGFFYSHDHIIILYQIPISIVCLVHISETFHQAAKRT